METAKPISSSSRYSSDISATDDRTEQYIDKVVDVSQEVEAASRNGNNGKTHATVLDIWKVRKVAKRGVNKDIILKKSSFGESSKVNEFPENKFNREGNNGDEENEKSKSVQDNGEKDQSDDDDSNEEDLEKESEDEKEEVFYWEKEISFGYKAQKNVLHFPWGVTMNCLFWDQKEIVIVDEDTANTYSGKIHCAKRNGKMVKKEKFIGTGWYEYAKKKKLRRGDKLGFSIHTVSPETMYVSLLNR